MKKINDFDMKKINDNEYLGKICDLLSCVEEKEQKAMELAASSAYQSIKNGGLLHVFSSGHSHMIAEEMFYRAGGLVPINPILDESLMVHKGALQSTRNERVRGKAEEILEKENLKEGDTIIISSNSGINVVGIEAALFAKRKGLTVVAITSVESSKELESRHESKKKLYQVSDVVIDNHVPFGDGMLTVPVNNQTTAGGSTFSSLFIAQRIVLMIENLYLEEGETPPVFISANVPNGMEHNLELIEQYKDRITLLQK
ncbi:MAG TPA: SIS domain-containing protein [Clostridiales bacterium]|nr:SIS domain-containing protein [Clostridiales bacterium]